MLTISHLRFLLRYSIRSRFSTNSKRTLRHILVLWQTEHDLNTVYSTAQAGTYTLSGSGGYINAPVITTGTGILEVVRGGSSTISIIQRITAGAFSTWREATDASAGTWSAWSQYETVASVDTKIAALGPSWAYTRSVAANGNLNTYRTPGWSRIRTPDTATILNLPPGMRSAGMFANITTGDGTDTILAQVVIENGANARFAWRSVIDSVANTFTPWVFNNRSAREVTEWHVAVVIGQSNASGRGIVSTSDGGKYVTNRIAQYGAKDRDFETATVPLDMHDTASGLSPATAWAHNYLLNQPDHVGVLLVPAAHGSTGFTNSTGTYTWTPGIATNPAFNLPALAVTQTQEALAAARATGAIAELKAIIFHQGENNGSTSTNTYAGYVDSLISYLRTQFGISNLPFLVGQMVPEGIAANSPGRANIDLAHQQTPTRMPYTGFAPATTGGHNPGDTTHMSQVGVDYIGRTYFEAYGRALLNTGNDQAEAIQNGRIAALEAEAGFDGDGLDLADSAFQALIVDNSSLTSGALVSQASTTGKPLNTTIKAIAAAAADGITYADLGVIPSSSLPPLVIIETTPVASQAAMLALAAQRGDVAIRTDLGKSFILSTDNPTVLADWKELLAPGVVASVAGRVGAVTLTKTDVGLNNVDNTSDVNKPVSTAQATALGLKEDKASKGAASGYAPLDTGSRVPVANLPTTLPTLLANNAKPDTDAPSTWPLGVSYMSTTSNGFGVNFGTVMTTRTGISSRSTQWVLQSSANLMKIRAETGGDVWGPWSIVNIDLVNATTLVAGLMSTADKTKLDGANSIGTAGTLVRYSDGAGLFAVATPTSGSHPTTKTYVDDAVGLKLNTSAAVVANTPSTVVLRDANGAINISAATGASHAVRKDQFDTELGNKAGTAVATGAVAGLMSAADKTTFDAATASPNATTLVKRNAAGQISVGEPTAGSHSTTKTYLDSLIAALPQGGINNGHNTSSTLTAALNTVETMVLEVSSVSMVLGRGYRISFYLDIQSTTAASVGVRVELSHGGTGGSPNGNLIKGFTAWSAPVASAAGNLVQFVVPWFPTATATTRFNVSVIRNSGTADFKIGERDLLIEDMGSVLTA